MLADHNRVASGAKALSIPMALGDATEVAVFPKRISKLL